jgi:uncharacterized membrane protein
MDEVRHGPTDDQVEQVVGNLLRIGVIVAAAVVAVGAVFYLVRHGEEPVAPMVYDPTRKATDPVNAPAGPVQIIRDAGEGRGRGLIALGLLLLIATPVARVLFSAFAFAAQRDYKYVVITLIVLAVLLYSLVYGRS